jgi:hypothetical protein
MKCAALIALAATGLFAFQHPAAPPAEERKATVALQADPLLRACVEELSRARTLRSLGQAVYYIEISIDDADSFSVGATLGANYEPQHSRLRPVRVAVRVGSPKFDNTNSIYSDYFSGTRLDSEQLPLDNDVPALRSAIWLSLDRAYKMAVEGYGRKAAAMRGVTAVDDLGDFWDTPGVSHVEETRRIKIDEDAWVNRVRQLSAIFLDYPAVANSAVNFESSQGTFYLINTLRSVVRSADRVAMFRVQASAEAPDGMQLAGGITIASLDPSQMPSEPALRQATEDVARGLTALVAAPRGEAYTGPVLFAGQSAAQVFGEVWGSQLSLTRRPVSEPGRPVSAPVSDLEGRLGMRVLPEWMSLTDDPALKEYRKRPLLGSYASDLEGVAPEPLTLVDKGVLKAVLTTRQPVRGMSGSNGHARIPGALGVKTARPSNLFVKTSQGLTDDQLKARLIEMIKAQGKPYGMLVRRMDFPSVAPIDDLRRAAARAGRSGAGRPVSQPVLLYRVYPDGREELVRGLRFRSLTARSFRDIVAAGSEEYQFDYVDNGALMAMSGASSFIVGCSVVAPAMLFEDLELEPAWDDMPKPSVVPPPPFSAKP